MRKAVIFILSIFILAGCEEEVKLTEAKSIPLKVGMEKRIQQDNAFALDLFNQVLAQTTDKNVFISPLSVSIVLGMAWNGADSETKAEMEATLKMSGMTTEQINEYYQIMQKGLMEVDPSTKLNIANSIWYKTGFPIKPDYLKVNQDYFGAEVRELNFNDPKALGIINGWCAEKTNNLIKEPLDQISAEAVMYLINAIYFKGIWSKQFDKKKTYEADFTTETKTKVKADMMNQKDTFGYYKDATAQYLNMPYGNKAFSMTVILPTTGKTTTDVLEILDLEKWNEVFASLHSREVQVYLPKFKTTCKYELKEPLMAMGMIKAFSGNADFSKISDWQLFISRVIHSTYCDVNEEGTEAAAVTIIEMKNTAMPEIPFFIANKPFIFVIRESSTGVILFMGKMGEVEKYN